MNYLAHVYLSGSDNELCIGNFIADHVKGKAYLNYPEGIQAGILLHRKIDHFTDNHQLFKKNVSLLFPQYRHYSRVIVDMFFDHLLAAQWKKYHPDSLEDFSHQFYSLMKRYEGHLPEKVKKMIPIISHHNWFLNYQTFDGLEKILFQMSQRIQFPCNMSLAITELKENYHEIISDFNTFFVEIKDFVFLEKQKS
ncbi:MAG: acyl carrier protein phosphodiesterase [Flavobacteriaceae bacterium]|jgi:acyl carrier protein phosphodiesterase